MLEKYDIFKSELQEIENRLVSEASSNPQKLKELSRRHQELQEILGAYESLKKVQDDKENSEKILITESDPEMKSFIAEQIEENKGKIAEIEKRLQLLLLPKDPNENKNIIVEIRAGTGGEEAALFAGNLLRMYLRYAERKNWKTSLLSENRTGLEGVKEVIIKIEGDGAYSRLKYESGVHRVQRVPETESQGRVHTSAATVAVLPEAEEVDLEIESKDIRIDVFRSSGPGGQSVNTTDSAVRITHLPTGMVVSCQDEKSQLKNRDKALSILRSRLLAQKQEEEAKKRSDARKSQIGTGDRSEKIRTYNYPQDRVTDHRINFSVHNLPELMDGNLDGILEKLSEVDRERLLAEVAKK